MATQLSFVFPKSDKFLLDNFIPHSGVIDTFNSLIEQRKILTAKDCKEGKLILVFGPAGSGKTHLIRSLFLNISKSLPLTILDYDVEEAKFYEDSSEISTERFIALYQALKLKPSALFVLTRGPLIRDEIDPHVYSRLVSGEICEITYPPETELQAVLKCILERHGMRLEDKDLVKIVNQVPAVPECFTLICKELEGILASGEKFRPSLLKSILSRDDIARG